MTTISTGATFTALPKLRITRRGRLVLTVAISSLALSLLGLVVSNSAVATGDQSSNSFEYLTVAPGESLWELAQSIAPNADPRDVIAEISRLNGLQNSTVYPGEQIAIPSQYSNR